MCASLSQFKVLIFILIIIFVNIYFLLKILVNRRVENVRVIYRVSIKFLVI